MKRGEKKSDNNADFVLVPNPADANIPEEEVDIAMREVQRLAQAAGRGNMLPALADGHANVFVHNNYIVVKQAPAAGGGGGGGPQHQTEEPGSGIRKMLREIEIAAVGTVAVLLGGFCYFIYVNGVLQPQIIDKLLNQIQILSGKQEQMQETIVKMSQEYAAKLMEIIAHLRKPRCDVV